MALQRCRSACQAVVADRTAPERTRTAGIRPRKEKNINLLFQGTTLRAPRFSRTETTTHNLYQMSHISGILPAANDWNGNALVAGAKPIGRAGAFAPTRWRDAPALPIGLRPPPTHCHSSHFAAGKMPEICDIWYKLCVVVSVLENPGVPESCALNSKFMFFFFPRRMPAVLVLSGPFCRRQPPGRLNGKR